MESQSFSSQVSLNLKVGEISDIQINYDGDGKFAITNHSHFILVSRLALEDYVISTLGGNAKTKIYIGITRSIASLGELFYENEHNIVTPAWRTHILEFMRSFYSASGISDDVIYAKIEK